MNPAQEAEQRWTRQTWTCAHSLIPENGEPAHVVDGCCSRCGKPVEEVEYVKASAVEAALPDPEKLELLAEWFDLYDDHRNHPGAREVQRDLRRWAEQARAALGRREEGEREAK